MNGHLPPLSALRAFETAARLKSFSKAAEELNVTPAAISHQIHALEADLGVSLFHRLNRQVELTQSGRLLLPGLSEAFAGIRAAVRRVRAHNETGALTITASPSFVAKWLVLRLHRFQEKFPAVDVRISTSDEIVDLTTGDFDLAIRYGTGRYPGLDVELLLKNDWHTRGEARRAIFRYIEIWYNRKRRHSTLGYINPAEYEDQLLQAAA